MPRVEVVCTKISPVQSQFTGDTVIAYHAGLFLASNLYSVVTLNEQMLHCMLISQPVNVMSNVDDLTDYTELVKKSFTRRRKS